MRFGILRIFCPMCKKLINYNESRDTYHSKEFGILCSKPCYLDAERRYVRMILGKDDPEVTE